VFNPILQGEKFDKEGEYVKKYCPELKDLPKKYIHKPWEASHDILSAANVILGQDYPKPIVDLKETRVRALDAFNQIKGG
jgi:deoxyribodipyrimidine photo-lyase